MWGHQKEPQWILAGPILQFFEPGQNALKPVEVSGKNITLAQWNGKHFAFAQKCPHAGGILANGYIDATGCITCPLHHYKFNMETGRNISSEEYYLKTYPVKTDGIELWIGM